MAEPDKETTLRIVELLEFVRDHSRLYGLGIGDGEPTVFWLEGFNRALEVVGLNDQQQDLYPATVEERGWRDKSHHPKHEMIEKGLSGEALFREIVQIEIDAWKKVLTSFVDESS
jgi:hypothetical protein